MRQSHSKRSAFFGMGCLDFPIARAPDAFLDLAEKTLQIAPHQRLRRRGRQRLPVRFHHAGPRLDLHLNRWPLRVASQNGLTCVADDAGIAPTNVAQRAPLLQPMATHVVLHSARSWGGREVGDVRGSGGTPTCALAPEERVAMGIPVLGGRLHRVTDRLPRPGATARESQGTQDRPPPARSGERGGVVRLEDVRPAGVRQRPRRGRLRGGHWAQGETLHGAPPRSGCPGSSPLTIFPDRPLSARSSEFCRDGQEIAEQAAGLDGRHDDAQGLCRQGLATLVSKEPPPSLVRTATRHDRTPPIP